MSVHDIADGKTACTMCTGAKLPQHHHHQLLDLQTLSTPTCPLQVDYLVIQRVKGVKRSAYWLVLAERVRCC